VTCEELGLGVGRGPIRQLSYSKQAEEKWKERIMDRDSRLEL
jgi:hypothetical protein